MSNTLIGATLWIAVLVHPVGSISEACVTPDEILESLQEQMPAISRYTLLSGEGARAIARAFKGFKFVDKVEKADIVYNPVTDTGIVQLFDSAGCNLMTNGRRAPTIDLWTGAFIGSFSRWAERYLREA